MQRVRLLGWVIVSASLFSWAAQNGNAGPCLTVQDYCTFPPLVDGSCIILALNALPSSGGCINLPSGNIHIRETITYNKPDTHIVGVGPDESYGSGSSTGTSIVWQGGAAPMFVAGGEPGWSLEGVSLDCQNVGTLGIDVVSARGGRLSKFRARRCEDVAIRTSTDAGANAESNSFEDTVLDASETSHGGCYRAEGSNGLLTLNNRWNGLKCLHRDGDGLRIENSSNDVFEHLAFEKPNGGEGISLHLTCTGFPSCVDSVTPQQSARGEVFIDVSGGPGTSIVQDGAADGNAIYGLDFGRGMATPVALSGNLLWQEVGSGTAGASKVAQAPTRSRTNRDRGDNDRPMPVPGKQPPSGPTPINYAHPSASADRRDPSASQDFGSPSASGPNYFANMTFTVSEDYQVPPLYQNTYVMASGNVTVNLYSPSQLTQIQGQNVYPTVTVKNVGDGTVTIGGVVDGKSNYQLSSKVGYVSVVSDWTNWNVVGGNTASGSLPPGTQFLPGFQFQFQQPGWMDVSTPTTFWDLVGGIVEQGRVNIYQLQDPGPGSCTVKHSGKGGSGAAYTIRYLDSNSGWSLPASCNDPAGYTPSELDSNHTNTLWYHQPGGYSNMLPGRGPDALNSVVNTPNHVKQGVLSELTACLDPTGCIWVDDGAWPLTTLQKLSPGFFVYPDRNTTNTMILGGRLYGQGGASLSGGTNVQGRLTTQKLPDPKAPSVTANTKGNVTATYYVVYHDLVDGVSNISPGSTITDGTEPANTSISWDCYPFYNSVDLLKNDTSQALATNLPCQGSSASSEDSYPLPYVFTDTGQDLSAYVPPTRNSTADAYIAGALTAGLDGSMSSFNGPVNFTREFYVEGKVGFTGIRRVWGCTVIFKYGVVLGLYGC